MARTKTEIPALQAIGRVNWDLRCTVCGASRAWHGDSGDIIGLGHNQKQHHKGAECTGFEQPVPLPPPAAAVT